MPGLKNAVKQWLTNSNYQPNVFSTGSAWKIVIEFLFCVSQGNKYLLRTHMGDGCRATGETPELVSRYFYERHVLVNFWSCYVVNCALRDNHWNLVPVILVIDHLPVYHPAQSKFVVLNLFNAVTPEKNLLDFNYPFEKVGNWSMQSINDKTTQKQKHIFYRNFH